jgi:hypothetical protein
VVPSRDSRNGTGRTNRRLGLNQYSFLLHFEAALKSCDGSEKLTHMISAPRAKDFSRLLHNSQCKFFLRRRKIIICSSLFHIFYIYQYIALTCYRKPSKYTMTISNHSSKQSNDAASERCRHRYHHHPNSLHGLLNENGPSPVAQRRCGVVDRSHPSFVYRERLSLQALGDILDEALAISVDF